MPAMHEVLGLFNFYHHENNNYSVQFRAINYTPATTDHHSWQHWVLTLRGANRAILLLKRHGLSKVTSSVAASLVPLPLRNWLVPAAFSNPLSQCLRLPSTQNFPSTLASPFPHRWPNSLAYFSPVCYVVMEGCLICLGRITGKNMSWYLRETAGNRPSLELQGHQKAAARIGNMRCVQGELPAVPGLIFISGTGVKPLPSFPESSLLPGLLS